MTTDELKALGLEESQIKEIFRLHGIAVNEFKKNNKVLSAEKENLEAQLELANSKIDNFKDLDVDAIKQEAESYKQKYEESKDQYQNEINQLKRDFNIESALTSAKVKNTKAAKALLDLDALTTADDFDEALKSQINTMRESDSYLFQASPQDNSIRGTGNPEKSTKNMTYSEMMDYLSKNPGAEI